MGVLKEKGIAQEEGEMESVKGRLRKRIGTGMHGWNEEVAPLATSLVERVGQMEMDRTKRYDLELRGVEE
jgi:hypothetical protein